MDDFTVSKPCTTPVFFQLSTHPKKSDPDRKVTDEKDLRKRRPESSIARIIPDGMTKAESCFAIRGKGYQERFFSSQHVTESDGRGLDLTRPEWQKKRKRMASRAGQRSGRAR